MSDGVYRNQGRRRPPLLMFVGGQAFETTLQGAVIRDKRSGTVWRVVVGDRMHHVQHAIAHAIAHNKTLGTRNARAYRATGCQPGRVLAQVTRIVGPWAAKAR